jgi:hypothetical protein
MFIRYLTHSWLVLGNLRLDLVARVSKRGSPSASDVLRISNNITAAGAVDREFVYIYIYIYTRIFGPRFARPRFFAARGLSLDVSPCFRILPFRGFTKALGNIFFSFFQPQSTTISRCCLYFVDFRALDPQSGGKRCTETSNDTDKVAQGSKNGYLLECFWSFVGLMANAIC